MSEQAGAAPAGARGRVGAAPRVQVGEPGRLEELDAMRGLAALGVVLFHYTTFYQLQHGHVQPLGFGFPAGNYGVHLFFLISGFVIFMTLDRARSAGDFMVSRFSRLFPAYWTALGLTALVVYAIGMPAQRPGLATLAANTTMLQEILGFEDVDGSYWTLQVELFFYAQMLFWFALRQLHRIPWIIAGWLLLTLAYALSLRQGWHFSYTSRVLLNLLYIPFFALGILFYRLHAARGSRIANHALILASLATIGLAYEPVYLAVALACTAAFALFLAGGLRWLRGRLFLFLGGISYSLYLLHQAIGFAVIHRLEHRGVHSLAAISIALLLALGLATALNRFVERPAMRAIRRRWQRLHAGAGVAVRPAPVHVEPMREPHRSRFIALVRQGAAARDIHDSEGAGDYDRRFDGGVSERFLERELGRVAMHAQSLCVPLAARLGRTPRILDIGCGTGGTTVALAMSSLAPDEVVGIDASREAIDAAAVRALGHGLDPARVRFLHVEAGERLPFPDGHFDLVTCVSVLEFVGSDAARRAFVAEMLRVTRRGGHAYLATPSPLRLREYHSRRLLGDWRRRRGYPWSSSAPSLRRMFEGCTVESLSVERLRRHPRLRRVGWAAPALSWALPWQRILARKD